MSAAEARVLIARLLAIIEDLNDLTDDAPLHVAAERRSHIETLRETVADLQKTYGVSA